MPHASINLEDRDVGVDVRYVYAEGFDKASLAHQLTNVIRNFLDGLAANGDLEKLGDDKDFGDMADAKEQLAGIADGSIKPALVAVDPEDTLPPVANDERAGTLVA